MMCVEGVCRCPVLFTGENCMTPRTPTEEWCLTPLPVRCYSPAGRTTSYVRGCQLAVYIFI